MTSEIIVVAVTVAAVVAAASACLLRQQDYPMSYQLPTLPTAAASPPAKFLLPILLPQTSMSLPATVASSQPPEAFFFMQRSRFKNLVV